MLHIVFSKVLQRSSHLLWIFWWFLFYSFCEVLKKVAIKKPTLIGKKLSMAARNTAGMTKNHPLSTEKDVGNLDVCIQNLFLGDTWQLAMCPSCHVGSFASNCY